MNRLRLNKSQSGHIGCLIELFVLAMITWLSLPVLGACRRHVVEWGWWSLAGVLAVLAGLGLYLFAAIKWFQVNVPWAKWAIFGWISALLLADGLLLTYEKRLQGFLGLLPPIGFVGGFWILCWGVRTFFKKLEKNDDQHK